MISRAPGYAGSLQQFLFGSITGVTDRDIVFAAVTAVVVIGVVALLHRQLVCVGLDRETARANRLPVFALDLLLYVLVTAVVVICVQTIGNILVLALLVTPAATARLLTDKLVTMMLLSPAIGGLSALVGLYLSWAVDLPVGGTIVLIATLGFLAAWLFAPHGVLRRRRARDRGAEPAVAN